jgi:hypothetical protein
MIVSLTVVRYKKRFIPFALLAMALHRIPLALNYNCRFWKLMGSGRNGAFDLRPDWQQWALLATWNEKTGFQQFFQNSFISKWWKVFCLEQWTILLEPLSGHGKWDNKEPFEYSAKEVDEGPIAVLTRATIRLSRLKNFWSNIDKVAAIMSKSPGFITSIGIGEAPVYRQATFSVWKNTEAIKHFAYQSKEHQNVIRKTREEGWYSEELFARFKPIASFGTLDGKNPLSLHTQNEL